MEKLIIPATFTFIEDSGIIDIKATRKYIQHLIKKGIKGFYVNGSTAEVFMLSVEDRMKVLEIIREEVPSDLLLMVQIGTISTKESLRLAIHAKKVGVDVLSAITPFYYKFTWQEIYHHYKKIMDSVDLPFCPYYIPHMSGVGVHREQIGNLLQESQVLYLKYSSNDFYTLQKLKHNYPNTTIFNGSDEMLSSGMIANADGAIGSTYNFSFNYARNIITALEKGAITTVQENQNVINTFVDVLLKVGLWQGMKYLFTKIGIGTGNPVLPFLPISNENKKLMDEFIQTYPDFLE